jgi:hypothetical protein
VPAQKPSDLAQLEQHDLEHDADADRNHDDLEQHAQSDAEPELTATEITDIAGEVVRSLEQTQPEPEPSEDPQPSEDAPKTTPPPEPSPEPMNTTTPTTTKKTRGQHTKKPLKTSEFRNRHAEALKHFDGIVKNPPEDLLEKVRKIHAGMNEDFNQWPPNATDI